MTEEFDSIVGFQYLKGMHLNDSKGVLSCRADRHENIGKGEIGLECFKAIGINRHLFPFVISLSLYPSFSISIAPNRFHPLLSFFLLLVNDKRFANIPLVLETEGPYKPEIGLLYSLIETDQIS